MELYTLSLLVFPLYVNTVLRQGSKGAISQVRWQPNIALYP